MRLFTSYDFENSYLLPPRSSEINFCYKLAPFLAKFLYASLSSKFELNGAYIERFEVNDQSKVRTENFVVDKNELIKFFVSMEVGSFTTYRSRLTRMLNNFGIAKPYIKDKSCYKIAEEVAANLEVLPNYELISPFATGLNIAVTSGYGSQYALSTSEIEKIKVYQTFVADFGSVPSYEILCKLMAVDRSSTISAWFNRLPQIYVSTFARVIWSHGYKILDPAANSYKFYKPSECRNVSDNCENGICLIGSPTLIHRAKKPIIMSEIPAANPNSLKLNTSYVLLVKR